LFKMVIADDEQLIRDSLQICIDWGKYGIEIASCCKNGIEALDVIIDTYPDLILLDIKMPGLTGLELLEKINERDQDVEVILLSGYKDFDYAKKAIRFGVTDYLLKPINEELLVEAVQNAQKKHREKMRIKKLSLREDETIEAAESSTLIIKLKKYVADHIADPGLTLKWIAERVLFMNADYVSRRFLAETGEKFSVFLTRTRMEAAKEMFPRYGKDNMHEVAVRVGCGNSFRYFSQVFKKYTGMSPVQYLKEMRGSSF